jgi:hypothetical protein
MTNHHEKHRNERAFSIVPPPELVEKWLCSDDYPWGPLEQTSITITTNRFQNVATQSAQYGADRELEACCEWLHWQNLATHSELIPSLRAARRPKPPSLKEQALKALRDATGSDYPHPMTVLNAEQHSLIRRALEALND